MANWCQNYLQLSGDIDEKLDILKEFKKMQAINETLHEGAAFNKLPIVDGYFFDIYIDDETNPDSSIQYQTKWGPNVKDLIKIAKQYKTISFTLEFEESGSCLYGCYKYENGVLYLKELEDDYPEYEEDDDNWYNLLEDLLDKKEFVIVTETENAEI